MKLGHSEREATEGAVEALWEALEKIERGEKRGRPQEGGVFNPKVDISLRWIDWHRDSTEEGLRKIVRRDNGKVVEFEEVRYGMLMMV